jgi:hypothetical protein
MTASAGAGSVLYRLCGLYVAVYLCLLVLCLIWIAAFGDAVIYSDETETLLRRLPRQRALFHSLNALGNLVGPISFLALPLALYLSLRENSPGVGQFATALALGNVAVTCAGIFGTNAALALISGRHAQAGSEPERAGYAAAVDLGLGIRSGAEVVASVFEALWMLTMCVVMVQGVFPQWLAWLGIAAGLSGVIGQIAIATIATPLIIEGYDKFGLPKIGDLALLRRQALRGLPSSLGGTWLIAVGIHLFGMR